MAHGSQPATNKANINEAKNGVVSTTLKVYSWFDEGEPGTATPGLTEQQVKTLVEAGKVAINRTNLHEPNILLEDLLNGPYFGDDRSLALTSDRLLKIFQEKPSHEIETGTTQTFSDITNTEIVRTNLNSLETVGTTDKVRGGLSQEDKVILIKAIKASYDRIGIDTQEENETDTKVIDYATPEERQTDTGKVILYEFRDSFLGWSPNLRLEHTDFLMTSRTMAVATSADLGAKMRLSAEISREYGHREFLFRQRPQVGRVLALPPALTTEPNKYIFFLVTRSKEFDRVRIEDLFRCLEALRDKLVETNQTSVSLPIIEPGRGNIKLRDLYSLLATIFFSTDITVCLHDRYYLSQV